LLPLDHVKNEQGRIFEVKIGFFEMVAVALCKVKASGILLYAGMKVIDDPLILKSLILVVPEALSVQPERYFSFGNDDFSEPARHELFHSRRIGDHQSRAKKLKSFLHTDLPKDTFVGKGMQLNHGGFDTGASLLYDSFLGKKIPH
jgi:hypothetical protein